MREAGKVTFPPEWLRDRHWLPGHPSIVLTSDDETMFAAGGVLDDGTNLMGLCWPGGQRAYRYSPDTGWALEERFDGDAPARPAGLEDPRRGRHQGHARRRSRTRTSAAMTVRTWKQGAMLMASADQDISAEALAAAERASRRRWGPLTSALLLADSTTLDDARNLARVTAWITDVREVSGLPDGWVLAVLPQHETETAIR